MLSAGVQIKSMEKKVQALVFRIAAGQLNDLWPFVQDRHVAADL